jgi:hypothetical protein
MKKYLGISELIGKTITEFIGKEDDCEIIIKTSDGSVYKMEHEPDCCEYVYIEDICGEVDSILNSPVLKAYESTNGDLPPAEGSDQSYTWTFYHISTIKGTITIRWFGSSNGYYSESVEFFQINNGIA